MSGFSADSLQIGADNRAEFRQIVCRLERRQLCGNSADSLQIRPRDAALNKKNRTGRRLRKFWRPANSPRRPPYDGTSIFTYIVCKHTFAALRQAVYLDLLARDGQKVRGPG